MFSITQDGKVIKECTPEKIFEYLGVFKPILIAPSDQDVLENLIKETKSGKTAHTINEMASILNEWHNEWTKYEQIKYDGDMKIIQNYSRENQGKKLISIIKNSL